MTGNFDDPRHAYLTGHVLAELRGRGIDAVACIDTEGDYLPMLELTTTIGRVTVRVEPPEL